MLRVLKILISLGILVCMFLPISQCSYTPEPLESSLNLAPTIYQITIAEQWPPTEMIDYVILLSFIFPLIFSMLCWHQKKLSLIVLILQTVFSIWFICLIYDLAFRLYSPLLTGYILIALAFFFFLVSSLEWFKLGKKHDLPIS